MVLSAFLIFSMLAGTTLGNPHYIGYRCQEKNSYSSNSVFEANLNDTLFTHFPTEANTFGFSNFTKGTDDDQVYALFYCKGDVDAAVCLDCVEAAARKITQVCKFWKEGIVWFEECTLRYANRTIFSVEEEDPYYLYYNNTGIVNEYHLDPYKQEFDRTMDALINQAAYSQGFATKQVNLSSSQILEGLAQCTPDIVGRPCYRCLKAALRLMDTWANTAVFLPSCLIRYDLYGNMPPPPLFRPPPRLQGFHIAIIVVVVVILVLAVIGGFLLSRPRLPGGEDSVQRLPKFTYSQVKQMTNKFSEGLGKGACGVVYRGRLLGTSKEVAIKLLNKEDGPTQFNNEIDVLQMARHNNIVSLLGYCQSGTKFSLSFLGYCHDRTKLALVCEYMNSGDLKDRLSDSCSLSWMERLQIAIDTAEGLCYLHDHCNPPIVHRDVKPANILLHKINDKLEAKVADFGYSKIFPATEVTTLHTRVIGTTGYTAPEYFSSGLLNNKVDVYSFGVVLIQLITGNAPSFKDNVVELFQQNCNSENIGKILDSKVGRIVNYKSVKKAAEVAKSCVNHDPEKRPQMSQIVVDLKQSLHMESEENEGSCSTNSSLVSDSISGDPQVQENPESCSTGSSSITSSLISDTTASGDRKGKKVLGS